MPHILIHASNESGGLADYTHYQTRALQKAGARVTVLCSRRFVERYAPEYPVACVYRSMRKRKTQEKPHERALRLLNAIGCLLGMQWRLAWEVFRRKPDAVLFDSYMEYLSPLWVWPHLLLSRAIPCGYAAILHDPIRDFQVGPKWWHRLSVTLAYLPFRTVFVHQQPPEGTIPGARKSVEIPHGLYNFPSSVLNPQDIRKKWELPPESVVFLSFGFIRDNKNIDLLIRALVSNPNAALVVMGTSQASKDKPLSFYQNLAEQLGVSERVHFDLQFVPDDHVTSYFKAADFIAVTYDGTFHSQSGVLNIAASARQPVLASSGNSPLKQCVERFRLGVFVSPDDPDSLASGMATLCASVSDSSLTLKPEWDAYEAYASWDANALIVSTTLADDLDF